MGNNIYLNLRSFKAKTNLFNNLVYLYIKLNFEVLNIVFLYIQSCRIKFFLHKKTNNCTRGRQEDKIKSDPFQKLCSFLEQNDTCQYSMDELQEYMQQYLEGHEGYQNQWLKKKLTERYGKDIVITSIVIFI